MKSFTLYSKQIISTMKRDIRKIDKFVEKLNTLREYFRNELKWIQVKQTKYVNRTRHSISKFKINDKVMLDKRYIEIIKSNHSLNFKNLDLYKIIDVIDNHHVYKFELSSSMFVIHSIFHSWLLYLDNNNSLIEQHRSSSLFVITLEFNHHDVIKIVKSRLNRRKKDLDSNSIWSKNVKDYLQYKIHYENNEQ